MGRPDPATDARTDPTDDTRLPCPRTGLVARRPPHCHPLYKRTLRKILPDSTAVVFADVSSISDSSLNDLMVDARSGRVYVGAFGNDVYPGDDLKRGPHYVVGSDGSARLAADDFMLTNSANVLTGTRTGPCQGLWTGPMSCPFLVRLPGRGPR